MQHVPIRLTQSQHTMGLSDMGFDEPRLVAFRRTNSNYSPADIKSSGTQPTPHFTFADSVRILNRKYCHHLPWRNRKCVDQDRAEVSRAVLVGASVKESECERVCAHPSGFSTTFCRARRFTPRNATPPGAVPGTGYRNTAHGQYPMGVSPYEGVRDTPYRWSECCFLEEGGATAVSEALEHYELRDRVDSLAALPDGKTGPDPRMKTRRMSTPHPIKVRSERSPPNQHRARRGKLRRSRSAPDLMDRARRTKRVFQASSSQAGDLAVQPEDFSSDEEEEGCDSMSLETASETSSVSSIGRQAILDEIFEEEPPSYVEALWDHVTLDPEELGFRAGEVVEVTDMADKDWWWGKLRDREGWFPATFVRLRANQADTADDFAARVKEGLVDADLVLARYSPNLLSKDQARTNVVNEIMNAEREYAKHLRDVIEGYVEKCRKRPEMFKKEQMETIFSNIEAIYKFSQELLTSLEVAFMADAPQTSQIGNVFLKHSEGFTIYSEYCNNHPHACEELRSLQKSKKYQHFFEACRLLQQMIEIPLEGFLLTPVQKICKYPLQLNELLKYTRPEHADRKLLSEALVAMKRIAVLINERKRKMESLQKLEEWQELVQDWESPDLLESSSELIYCGELTKVNSSGWSQERIFFLFDFQIIYCKKDLLWRDIMVYKGRIDIDEAEVIPVEDGKDTQFNVTVRNGFKIYDRSKDKWYLLYARTQADKDRWLRSLEEERQRVELDRQNGFCLEEYRGKMPQYVARQRAHPDTKVKGDKAPKRKVLRMPFPYQHEQLKNIPSHVTLPRSVSSREALLYGQMSNKKRGWNPFSKVKTKR